MIMEHFCFPFLFIVTLCKGTVFQFDGTSTVLGFNWIPRKCYIFGNNFSNVMLLIFQNPPSRHAYDKKKQVVKKNAEKKQLILL